MMHKSAKRTTRAERNRNRIAKGMRDTNMMRQEYFTDAQGISRVRYYHPTKGWRERRV